MSIRIIIPMKTPLDREIGMDLRDYFGGHVERQGPGRDPMVISISSENFQALLRQARNASALV